MQIRAALLRLTLPALFYSASLRSARRKRRRRMNTARARVTAVCIWISIVSAFRIALAVNILIPPMIDQVTILRNDSKNPELSQWRYLGYRCIRNMYADEQDYCGKFLIRSSTRDAPGLASLHLRGLQQHQFGDNGHGQPFVDVQCFDNDAGLVETYRIAQSERSATNAAASSASWSSKLTIKLVDEMQIELNNADDLAVSVSWHNTLASRSAASVRCSCVAAPCITILQPNETMCVFLAHRCAGPTVLTARVSGSNAGSGSASESNQNVFWTVRTEKYRFELPASSSSNNNDPQTPITLGLRNTTRFSNSAGVAPHVPENPPLRLDGFIVNDLSLMNISHPQAKASRRELLRVCCRFTNNGDSKLAYLVTWTLRQTTVEHSSVNASILPKSSIFVCINYTATGSDSVHLIQCTGTYHHGNFKAVTAVLRVVQTDPIGSQARVESAPIAAAETTESFASLVDANGLLVMGLIILLVLVVVVIGSVLFRKCLKTKKQVKKHTDRQSDRDVLTKPFVGECDYAPLTGCTCTQPLGMPCHSLCASNGAVVNNDAFLRASTYRTAGSMVDEHIHQARQSSQSPSNESGVVDERSYDSGIANGGTYQALPQPHVELITGPIIDIMTQSAFNEITAFSQNQLTNRQQTSNSASMSEHTGVPFTFVPEAPACTLCIPASPRLSHANWPPAEIELIPDSGTVFLKTCAATSV